MAIFDVIGPVMIGPSSSHTAGAARIGYFAKKIYGKDFDFVTIELFNSFANTGKGHGTDIAILGGLLGFMPDDMRILKSYHYAKERNLKFKFIWNKEEDEDYPPNCAKITFYDKGNPFFIVGNSVGGGDVEIINLNGYPVKMSGKHHTLVINSVDAVGVVAFITSVITQHGINIASMDVERDSSVGEALAVIKLDAKFPETEIREFYKNKNIKNVISIERLAE